MNIKVTGIARHRNGISGHPFYAVLFGFEGRRYVATVPEGTSAQSWNPGTTVLDVDMLASGDGTVAFGVNSHRGDQFTPALCAAITGWEAARLAESLVDR